MTEAIRHVAEAYRIYARLPATATQPERDPSPLQVAGRLRWLLSTRLGFLCRDPRNNVRFELSQVQSVLMIFQRRAFDHPFILYLARWFVFRAGGGLGVKYQRRFRGRYSIVLIAFICAAVRQGPPRIPALTTFQ